MKRYRNRIARALVGVLAAGFCATASVAGPVPVLTAKERSTWQAVGHLQGPGFRMKRGCTGTLIASDLVVTAAHCMTGAMWKSENQQFRAGWHNGSYTARSLYREVALHPLYHSSRGSTRLLYDIAVIRLSDPIPAELVTPLPLIGGANGSPRTATLLGYPHDRRDALSGYADCPVLPPPRHGLLRYSCEVVSGVSGGAVIAQTASGPVLAGIIVARHEPDGHALAVPVGVWLREKLRQADASASPPRATESN